MHRNRILFYLSLCSFMFFNDALQAAQIRLENAGKVQKLADLKGHSGPVFSLAFSPDSKLLVSGGSGTDYSMRVWNVSGGQRALLQNNTKQVAAVAFNADGGKILSAGYDGSIRTFDTRSNLQLGAVTKSADGVSFTMGNLFTTFSADGSALAYSDDSGEGPFLIHVATSKQLNLNKLVPPFDEGPGNVALNSTGSVLAAVGKGNVIHLIDATGKETGVLKPEESEYSGLIVFSRDGGMLAVSNYDSSKIQLMNVQTKQPGAALVGHKSNSDGAMMLTGLAFSPDSKLLASCSYDKTIRIWDTSSGKAVATLSPAGKGPSALAWSPDGTTIASADLDGTITLWGVR